jgi:RNA polymerase sigma-70 factor (ECF subfamily)
MQNDWDGILRDHGPTVWRTLWRLLTNRADCDECFQETFLAALKFVRSPSAAAEGVRNWSALLQRLATARAVDRLRQRYQHKDAFDPAADVDAAASHRPGPVELATASELSLRLRQALARLPEAHAQAFCLHALSGWSYEEVGRATGASSSAVGVNVHRARQRLKELLGDVVRDRSSSNATGGLS